MSDAAVKLVVAWSLLMGVFLGMVGTYLMTSAYHPFPTGGLMVNFLDMLSRLIRCRFKSAKKNVKAVVLAAEHLSGEKRDLSLTGIYFLLASFCFQVFSAIFAIVDVYRTLAATPVAQ